MGSYINPVNESKEEFLIREGERLSTIPEWESIPKGKMLVALVNNGLFTAAGILYSHREYMAFTDTNDRRPSDYYLVDLDKLLHPNVSDLYLCYGRL